MKKFLFIPMLAALLSCSSEDEHAVDLGLSVLWADCNVGANLPEEFGDYYSWGDTMANRPYTNEDCSSYPHCKDLDGDGDISTGSEFTYIGDDISGKEQYDAATAKWGNGWKMPTKEQFEELLTKCEWVPCEKNGVKGFQITGPNSNSIFLPIAGYGPAEIRSEFKDELFYWTSTFQSNEDAWALNSGHREPLWDKDRPIPAPIRPVKMREYKE